MQTTIINDENVIVQKKTMKQMALNHTIRIMLTRPSSLVARSPRIWVQFRFYNWCQCTNSKQLYKNKALKCIIINGNHSMRVNVEVKKLNFFFTRFHLNRDISMYKLVTMSTIYLLLLFLRMLPIPFQLVFGLVAFMTQVFFFWFVRTYCIYMRVVR